MHHLVEITTLPEASWAELRALRLRALQEEPHAFAQSYEEARAAPDELWQERLREAVAGTSWLVCARRNGQLVGMVGAFQSDEDRAQHQATVFGTYVEAAVRGAGIGQRLLAALLAQLVATGAVRGVHLTVNAQQSAAVRLYQAAGFRIVGESSVTLGDGHSHRQLIMEKPLS